MPSIVPFPLPTKMISFFIRGSIFIYSTYLMLISISRLASFNQKIKLYWHFWMGIKFSLSWLLLFVLYLWYNQRIQPVPLLNLLISILSASFSVVVPSTTAINTFLLCSGTLITLFWLVIVHSIVRFVRN